MSIESNRVEATSSLL